MSVATQIKKRMRESIIYNTDLHDRSNADTRQVERVNSFQLHSRSKLHILRRQFPGLQNHAHIVYPYSEIIAQEVGEEWKLVYPNSVHPNLHLTVYKPATWLPFCQSFRVGYKDTDCNICFLTPNTSRPSTWQHNSDIGGQSNISQTIPYHLQMALTANFHSSEKSFITCSSSPTNFG